MAKKGSIAPRLDNYKASSPKSLQDRKEVIGTKVKRIFEPDKNLTGTYS